MPTVTVNDLELAYDDFGNPDHPPVLLIQGLGLPSAAWPAEFIDHFLEHSLRVITFDNRDCGQSGKIEARPRNLAWQVIRQRLGLRVKAPYRLSDMMADTVGLLEALSIDAAHVVGISMGGMIAQLMAIHAPQRVRSLTSLMSTTGDRGLPGPEPQIIKHMLRRPPEDDAELRDAYYRKMWQLIGSPDFPTTDERRSQFLARVYERGINPAGTTRQLLAIMAMPGRGEDLGQVTIPTLVLHGANDPMIPVVCGEATARAIPGATLETIPGMGHDLPIQLMPRLLDSIVRHVRAAEHTVAGSKVA